MNPKAHAIFKKIFDKYSNDGFMNEDQCNEFTAACLGTHSHAKYYSDKISTVYARYD